MEQYFLQSEGPNAAPVGAAFHVIPAPLEATVSYGGGTAGGPAAILNASDQLETWDGVSIPFDAGIHTAPTVDCHSGIESALENIEATVGVALSCGARPIVLGGEHTVTLGALRALKKDVGLFGVVQFDAHADLRDSYEGTPFSHACVMRRALDDLGLPLFQIGVRALCGEEIAVRRQREVSYLDARDLYLNGIPEAPLPEDFPDKIYITFDLDGLDPSVIRATGTPVPGGIFWHDALTLLERVIRGREVLGADVVELAPAPGDHASDFAAAQLTYCIMGMMLRHG